jgi:hypothetical protein
VQLEGYNNGYMQAAAKPTRDTVVASATVQRTPRVGIVLSSYKGGGDHFGNAKFDGVPEPRPPGSELNDAQLRALTRRALELGNHPNTRWRRVIGRDESVLLLVNRYAEPGVVSAVVDALNEQAQGVRITVVSDAAKRFAAPTLVDIASAESMRMPAPGVWSRRDVTFRIPKAILQCDKVISIAPLRIENGRPSLSIDNYRLLSSGEKSGGSSLDVDAIDLFGFHPAEFAVLGGTHVLRDGKRVRHNLVLAGPIPTAVDVVGAAILNVKADAVPLLGMAGKRGFGDPDLDAVWTIGNEIEDARVLK